MTSRDKARPDVGGFEDLFDRILDEADGNQIEINDVIDAFGHRSFGSLILVPALLATLPTGAIPGVPVILGLVIILVCVQLLLGKSSPWIPNRLRSISVDYDVFENAIQRFRPLFQRLDSVLSPRMEWLTKPPFLQVVAVLAILLSLSFLPLEFIPFAVAAPGSAIIALGMGIATRDGLVILVGLTLCAATLFLTIAFFS